MNIKKLLSFAICTAIIIVNVYTYPNVYASEYEDLENNDYIDSYKENDDYFQDNIITDDIEELEEHIDLKKIGLRPDDPITLPIIQKYHPCREDVFEHNNNSNSPVKRLYYEYDSNNNLIYKSDGTGNEWVYEYDELGNINKCIYYERNDTARDGVKTKYKYSYGIIDGISYKYVDTYCSSEYYPDYCEYYYYDEKDRLIKYNGYEYRIGNDIFIDYSYDNNNNLIKETITKEKKFEYEEDEIYSVIFEYTSNGTLLKKTITGGNYMPLEVPDYITDYDNHTSYYYYDNTITTTGIYCASNYPSIQAGINVQKGNLADTVEYRWVACNNKNPDQWFEVSPWTRDNNWINWTPEESGGYVFVCYARVVGNEEESMIQSSFGTEYHKQIKGICQMPYTGPGGGYLIGIESYDNPNHSYKYEMLILDCNLYMQGKDAWVYTTGKCGAPENCLWTIWQPQYGYYWTLFRIYDANDNLIDEACYGFENIY